MKSVPLEDKEKVRILKQNEKFDLGKQNSVKKCVQ